METHGNRTARRDKEGGVCWGAPRCERVQNEDTLAGGEKVRERRVSELRNVAHCKQELTSWRGGRGRDGLVSLEMWHIAKRGLTSWRGGRGRSGLVSSETWHVAKRGPTSCGGGRGEPSWGSWKHGILEMT